MEKPSQIAWEIVPLIHLFPLKIVPLIEVLMFCLCSQNAYKFNFGDFVALFPHLTQLGLGFRTTRPDLRFVCLLERKEDVPLFLPEYDVFKLNARI
jgi:hypothetical protein